LYIIICKKNKKYLCSSICPGYKPGSTFFKYGIPRGGSDCVLVVFDLFCKQAMALESTVQLQQNDGNRTPEKPVDREKVQ